MGHFSDEFLCISDIFQSLSSCSYYLQFFLWLLAFGPAALNQDLKLLTDPLFLSHKNNFSPFEYV